MESSELLSNYLNKENINHQVLNAKNHAREAEIISQAGKPSVITIATNMAGRGTDIVLGGNWEMEYKNQENKSYVSLMIKFHQEMPIIDLKISSPSSEPSTDSAARSG